MKSLLFALALLPAALYSAPARAAPKELRAIVLAGTKLPQRVGDQLAAIKTKLDHVLPDAGYPKVVESKTIEGLKPGFEVIILGFCELNAIEGGIADLVEREAKRTVPGAYSRTVKTALPASCPRIKVDKPDDAEGAKLWAALERAPDSPDAAAALGHHLVSNGDLDGGEYLGLRALSKNPKHEDAKALLEKIGVLRTD